MDTNTKEIRAQYGISILKGLIGAIPFAGTGINEIIFEARSRLKQDRVNHFIEQFGAYMQNFSESEIKLEHIKSEEFGDFFEALLKKVSTTNNEDKINRYKELLGSQMVSPLPLDFSITFLELIERINEKQIIILNNLYDLGTKYTDHQIDVYEKNQKLERLIENDKLQQNAYVESYSENEFEYKKAELEHQIEKAREPLRELNHIFSPETYKMDWDEYLFLLQDLSSKALVIDTSYKVNDDPFSFVEITNFGISFIDFIKHR